MIVITGVSRGLGAALFNECHQARHRILALGRHFTADQQTAQEADPKRVHLRVTDLAAPDTLPGPVELAEAVGDADEVTIVHNAGVIEPFAAVGALQPEQMTAAVNINMLSPMLLTNALLAAVAGDRTVTGPGEPRVRVVYISSSAAHRPSGGRAAYCSTKAGAEMFFNTLALQHADDPSVQVSIVDPGIMDTDMQAVIRLYAHSGTYFPDRERFLQRHEQGELPTPQSVARRIIAEHLTTAAPPHP